MPIDEVKKRRAHIAALVQIIPFFGMGELKDTHTHTHTYTHAVRESKLGEKTEIPLNTFESIL